MWTFSSLFLLPPIHPLHSRHHWNISHSMLSHQMRLKFVRCSCKCLLNYVTWICWYCLDVVLLLLMLILHWRCFVLTHIAWLQPNGPTAVCWADLLELKSEKLPYFDCNVIIVSFSNTPSHISIAVVRVTNECFEFISCSHFFLSAVCTMTCPNQTQKITSIRQLWHSNYKIFWNINFTERLTLLKVKWLLATVFMWE